MGDLLSKLFVPMKGNQIEEIMRDCFQTGISTNITELNGTLQSSKPSSAEKRSKSSGVCVTDTTSNSSTRISKDTTKTSTSKNIGVEIYTNIEKQELNLNNIEDPDTNNEESENSFSKNVSWADIIGKEDSRRKSIVQLYKNQPGFEYTPELFYKALGITTE